MARLTLPSVCALLLAAGCQIGGGAVTAAEATEAVNEFMGENLPQVPLSELKLETVDLHDRWRVIYSPPDGSTGGPMIFEVDKQTGEIGNTSIPQ